MRCSPKTGFETHLKIADFFNWMASGGPNIGGFRGERRF